MEAVQPLNCFSVKKRGTERRDAVTLEIQTHCAILSGEMKRDKEGQYPERRIAVKIREKNPKRTEQEEGSVTNAGNVNACLSAIGLICSGSESLRIQRQE